MVFDWTWASVELVWYPNFTWNFVVYVHLLLRLRWNKALSVKIFIWYWRYIRFSSWTFHYLMIVELLLLFQFLEFFLEILNFQLLPCTDILLIFFKSGVSFTSISRCRSFSTFTFFIFKRIWSYFSFSWCLLIWRTCKIKIDKVTPFSPPSCVD